MPPFSGRQIIFKHLYNCEFFRKVLQIIQFQSTVIKMVRYCFGVMVFAIVTVAVSFGWIQNELSYKYYNSSCPNLEAIVKREMLRIFLMDATAPAAFLRLMFHDCQVQVRIHIYTYWFSSSLSLVLLQFSLLFPNPCSNLYFNENNN